MNRATILTLLLLHTFATPAAAEIIGLLETPDGFASQVGNVQGWVYTTTPGAPDGGAFVEFLGTLNGGEWNGATTTGCFANKCDWRLPTLGELKEILSEQEPFCTTPPCTTIPGETAEGFYWSSSALTGAPGAAGGVNFNDAAVRFDAKSRANHVRAVRGGY
jgi:hypothetical protein